MSQREIEAIEMRLKQLTERRGRLLAQRSCAERKRSTRQAIIIGAWILTRKPEVAAAVAKVLTRDQDRAAFGLPPLETAKPAATTARVDVELPLERRSAQEIKS